MKSSRSPEDGAVLAAMLASGAVGAHFVLGKAVRDALYLDALDVSTTFAAITTATAAVSLMAVAMSSGLLRRLTPRRFVPVLFVTNAALLLVEWTLAGRFPRAIAVVFYLHMTGLGPMFGSGFWLIAAEHFDPRTAKRRFGQVAGAGTFGGLVAGLLTYAAAERLSVTAIFPVLATLSVFTAWQIHRLTGGACVTGGERRAEEVSSELMMTAPRSGLRVLAEAPYLRNLAALVLLGTMGAGLLDYIFKVQVEARFTDQKLLLGFFLFYQTGLSVVTFILQTFFAHATLQRIGLGGAIGTPSLAALAGGIGGLITPALSATALGRAGESVLRGSLFRSAYELFYTPIAPAEKRAAKSLIDVGCDRLGEAGSGAVIQLARIAAPAGFTAPILAAAALSSAAAFFFATRVNRGYVQALERSLLNRAVELDLSEIEDMTTRTVMMRTLQRMSTSPESAARSRNPLAQPVTPTSRPSSVDPEIEEIMTLRSRDRAAILRVLQHPHGIPASLVPHTIPLLAWDPVAEAAVTALRKVAEERVGELIDALLDPNQTFAVRRRLARVFSICVSQRAADGLMLGLDDLRFEVRFQCARSLAAIVEKNALVRLSPDRIYEAVSREVTVGRPVWEGRRLLDRLDEESSEPSVDDFVKDRANQSLAHVFTLLSLALPAEPLRIAFRGLHTDDRTLRGTALEYLEGVLPPGIRERLWPFLEDPRGGDHAARGREEILAELLKSNQSIMLNLEDLKRRASESAKTATTSSR